MGDRGALTRIIASFEGTTLKVYTNGQRLYTLSGRVFARGQVLRVCAGRQDEEQAVYLARAWVAAGAVSVSSVVTAVAAPAPATALPIALPATQSGTITPPRLPPPPPTLSTGQVPGAPAPLRPGTRPPPRVAALVGPAPTGLRVFVATPRSASLGWTAVSGATGYTINRAPAGRQPGPVAHPEPDQRRALTEMYFRPAWDLIHLLSHCASA